jgi:1-acylglycerone phosphate reductase
MMHSDTLRLELAPFGVKVLAVTTGAIATNLMSHAPENYQLPPKSIYEKAFKEIRARAFGEDVKRMDAAERGDIMGGATGRIWRGAMASAVRFMMTFMPTSVVVCAYLGIKQCRTMLTVI